MAELPQPKPQPNSSDGSAHPRVRSGSAWLEGLRGLAVWAPVAALLGFVGPLENGWLPGLIALAIALVVATLRSRKPAAILEGLAGASGLARGSVVALVVLPTMVFCVVAARSIAALLVAFPGSYVAALAALVGVVICGALARTKARWLGALAAAVVILGAGAWGTRLEADTAGAVGSAHSGPVHGIHPFQMTAVIIDGYGPFDLPINDFVEPDGGKGYAPAELADAIERALHDIAEVHFSDGPQRARLAFADAEVEFVITAAVKERLDSVPKDAQQPRFVVRSGTSGQQSRVEFICPGRRDDPRGSKPDNVMNRMCPDKYASEASAGLGVTGRWPGYVEFRGNERFGLGRWLGWTRSSDARGDGFVEREHRYWAWMVLGIALLCVGVSRWLAVDAAAERVGAAVAIGGWAILVAAVVVGGLGPLAIAPLEDTTLPLPVMGMSAGVVVLWLLGGIPRLRNADGGAPHIEASATLGVLASIVVVCTLAAASNVASATWAWPSLFTDGPELALQRFVIAVAEQGYTPIATAMEWSVFELEGALAGVLVALLLCGVIALLARGASLVVAATSVGHERPRPIPAIAGAALIIAFSVAFVVSRKTGGGSSLLMGAVALTVVLQSTLALLAPPSGPTASWRRPLAIAGHIAWVAVAIFFVLTPQLPAPGQGSGMHPFALICIVVGVATALGAILVLFESSSRSA